MSLSQAECKFSKRPKYDVQLSYPNFFKREWVYSVPCGQCGPDGNWIFLDSQLAPEWGPDKKKWVQDQITSLRWSMVTNERNKRFICPRCSGTSRRDV